MSKMNKNLSTEPYKGVRDFYPPDMFVQNYIFETMRKIVESFGYVEYGASIIEPADLYKAKSGKEIVSDQTYSFEDRGEREVTLRPEMTPTVARMVARNRRELSLPIRWYSIPNLFRYEAPQRGRLREHWQLNVDIFGVKNIEAEVEMITIADKLMKSFGGKSDQFEILINNRKIIQSIFDNFELSEDESYTLSKVIDKKEKTPEMEFKSQIYEIIGGKTENFLEILTSKDLAELKRNLPKEISASEAIEETEKTISVLQENGIKNIRFSPTLMRGFDYYTGIVFEVFDKSERNRRSLFGGGRYDDLLDIFGSEKITAVGFGMGDVTIRDFLETYNLLPPYRPTTDLYICRVGEISREKVAKIAERLRNTDIRVAIDLTDRKVGDQIKAADRQRIPFVTCIGEDEVKSGEFKIKKLETGEEKKLKLEEVAAFIKTLNSKP